MQLEGPADFAVQPRGPRMAVEDLSIYEKHGGHTLGRHVGVTAGDAVHRIERGATAAGCFADRTTAQRAVDDAIQQHRGGIAAWLWGGGGDTRYTFVEDLGRVVGTVLTRHDVAAGRRTPAPATAVRVVLRPSDDLVSGFTLVTAYPTRARRTNHHRRREPLTRRAHAGVPA